MTSEFGRIKFNPAAAHLLAVGNAGHQVLLFDLRSPRAALAVLKGHRKAVSYVRWAGSDQLVSSSTDSTVRLWAATGTKGSSDNVLPAAAATAPVMCSQDQQPVLSEGPYAAQGPACSTASKDSAQDRSGLSGRGSAGDEAGFNSSSGWCCTQVFTGHTNSKHFVGLSTEGPFIACGSETNQGTVSVTAACGLPQMVRNQSCGHRKPPQMDVPEGIWKWELDRWIQLVKKTAVLHLRFKPTGRIHWEFKEQEPQRPLLLQKPAVPSDNPQTALSPADATLHLPVAASQTALLQLLSNPAGKLQWLLWVQKTHVPLLLQKPEAVPAPGLLKVPGVWLLATQQLLVDGAGITEQRPVVWLQKPELQGGIHSANRDYQSRKTSYSARINVMVEYLNQALPLQQLKTMGRAFHKAQALKQIP
eukprot:gene9554-9716_t